MNDTKKNSGFLAHVQGRFTHKRFGLKHTEFAGAVSQINVMPSFLQLHFVQSTYWENNVVNSINEKYFLYKEIKQVKIIHMCINVGKYVYFYKCVILIGTNEKSCTNK